MPEEDLVNIRCPYCKHIFTFDREKVNPAKPFLSAKCPYCEEGIVLSSEMILKSAQAKATETKKKKK